MFLIIILALSCCLVEINAGSEAHASAISAKAAEQCGLKLKNLEDFAVEHKPMGKQTTRFSEDEVNSYLALNLRSKYHPCLKSLSVTFEKQRLQGIASIDFDSLGSTSTRFLPKIIGILFSGTHELTARGQLLSESGKASFQLEQARFDDSNLPKFLVEEIITAVGRKQNPPFDPLKPSQMPYEIESVEVHQGYILVHQ
jgi:hypothetical protein